MLISDPQGIRERTCGGGSRGWSRHAHTGVGRLRLGHRHLVGNEDPSSGGGAGGGAQTDPGTGGKNCYNFPRGELARWRERMYPVGVK